MKAHVPLGPFKFRMWMKSPEISSNFIESESSEFYKKSAETGNLPRIYPGYGEGKLPVSAGKYKN